MNRSLADTSSGCIDMAVPRLSRCQEVTALFIAHTPWNINAIWVFDMISA